LLRNRASAKGRLRSAGTSRGQTYVTIEKKNLRRECILGFSPFALQGDPRNIRRKNNCFDPIRLEKKGKEYKRLTNVPAPRGSYLLEGRGNAQGGCAYFGGGGGEWATVPEIKGDEGM